MTGQKPKRTYQPWAVGITVFIVFFIVATITLGIFISGQHYDLVTQNYYEKTLVYQDEIDARQRTTALAERPYLVLDRTAKVCNIVFPARADFSAVAGDLTMYRISDAASDLRHDLALDAAGRQYISVSSLQPGQWIFKLRWEEAGLDYYLEERMYLD